MVVFSYAENIIYALTEKEGYFIIKSNDGIK
jgi:hypothetical protein